MNRLFLIFIASILMVSCSSNDESNKDAEKLESYKEQIKELKEKISEIKETGNNQEYTGRVIPVKVKTVTTQPFSHNFTAAGELESIEEAFISPEVNGQIISVNVEEGQHVKSGQILARLNTVIVENTISEVKTQLTLAKTIFDKQTILWNKNIGSERQYLEAKNYYESLQDKLNTLEAQRDMGIITSPIDGVVEEIFLQKGEMAAPGMQFMQIVNINKLYVTLKLSEAYLSAIKKGDIVDISFPAYPGLVYHEPVFRTGNVINEQDRTFVVQVEIDNKSGKLKPHMLVNVNINDYNTDEAIVLPSILIKEDMKGSFVYVLGDDNGKKFSAKKYIETGVSSNDKTEVVRGLKAGEVIITDGYNNVSNGSVVTII
jgi:membrane fusion protein, multidrug efflux system